MAPVLAEFSRRFMDRLDNVRLEDKTRTYRDGWRLLKGDNHRGFTIGSDYEQQRRKAQILRRALECQLRVANLEQDASQGRGVSGTIRKSNE